MEICQRTVPRFVGRRVQRYYNFLYRANVSCFFFELFYPDTHKNKIISWAVRIRKNMLKG